MDTKAVLSGLNFDIHSFKQLLDSQSLVDCTLACDGGKISAHKIVLSACSTYLAKILMEHPVEHPIIILPELNIEDVKTLVHYMYTGELLRSNTLNSGSLLRTAAILSVNSLNDFLTGNLSSQLYDLAPQTPTLAGPQLVATSPHDRHSPHKAPSAVASPQAAGHELTKTAPSTTLTAPTTPTPTTAVINNNITVSSNKSEFQFKCPVCHNDFQTICSFESHMQRIHSVTSFGCEICHKPFASLRYVLTDHMRRCHGWKAEQKLQC